MAKAPAVRERLYVELSTAPSIVGVIKLMRYGTIEKGSM
jgi:hypothetical protein